MARTNKKQSNDSAFVLFNIVYQDGTLSSNRKVPRAEADGLDGEDAARAFIEAQDRKIAEMSGNPRGPIKTMTRLRGQ
ncbi:hypothetical protein [Inquilinus limosus]|uniref:Uncharacterized protein n=1 Tax=Inquilinus limosus MP06 TaxID=1398085 RepID=A0A0A0CWK9_9PROT|nr:hypothetical protein [Inquilinus limosus]KGM30796.1 hypothetical protein P409_30920 [Inquilinus limosus MP06]